jgi:Ca2+-dependent lipid-binding protein
LFVRHDLRNDEEIGRTSVIPETLNPVWEDAHFEMPAPIDLLQSELVIDVYDHDDVGDHDFLGKVVLTGEELSHSKIREGET